MIEESRIQELLDRGTDNVYDELVAIHHRTDFWKESITKNNEEIVRFLCDGEVVGEVKVHTQDLSVSSRVFYKKENK